MNEVLTIGITIDVPEPLASEVVRVRAATGDPQAATVPAHVTLLPPTALPATQLVPVLDHLYALCARSVPFRVRLRGTATFRPKTPVVFLPLLEGGRKCAKLAAEIRSGPLAVQLNYPYYPHVTVAHNVPEQALDEAAAQLADTDFTFVVNRVRLDVQRGDGTWSPHSTFEFSGVARSAGIVRRSQLRRRRR